MRAVLLQNIIYRFTAFSLFHLFMLCFHTLYKPFRQANDNLLESASMAVLTAISIVLAAGLNVLLEPS